MMLKEKSNKWARLKLLLVLPLGILSVYAFARSEVDNQLSNFTESEITKNLSEQEFIENTVLQSPANPVKISMNDSISRRIEIDLEKEGYPASADRNLIGKEAQGQFKINFTTDLREKYITAFPRSFSKKAEADKSDYVKIYRYVFDNKRQTPERFWHRFKGGKTFFERSKIGSEYTEITEVHGIMPDGSKTPVFYMAMTDAAVKGRQAPPPPPLPSDNKSNSPVIFSAPKINKDNKAEKGVDPSAYNIDVDLSSYKIGDKFTDSKGREWTVLSKNPPKVKQTPPPLK